MRFDPPLLTEGPLTGKVYVVTHGKRRPHPTIEGEELIEASVKYDVTDQFEALAAKRSGLGCPCVGTPDQEDCPHE